MSITSLISPSFAPKLGIRRQRGQTLVEYALVLAVLTVVLITVFSLLSARIIVVFSAVANLLDTAQAGSH